MVESDLGEFIVQLRKEPPYHIVFPAMHLTRGDISDLFERELGSAPSQNPEDLTMIARKALRQKYITADMGLTGANFAIAETGNDFNHRERRQFSALSCGPAEGND